MLKIPITILPGNEDLPLPAYQTAHAAAMDLCAAVTGPVVLAPGEILLVGCGFAIAVPDGFEAQVRPRSGLAARSGITVVNSPRHDRSRLSRRSESRPDQLRARAFTIERGMRIAQLLVAPVARVTWEQTESLSETARGAGGFGHTGQS